MDHEVHPVPALVPWTRCTLTGSSLPTTVRFVSCLTSPLFKSDCDIRRAFDLYRRL